MRKVINATVLGACFCTVLAAVPSRTPSIDDLDAHARAEGNRKAIAVAVGRRLFQTVWPAQVLKIYANGIGTHTVIGIRLSGVKFHKPLHRRGFVQEVAALAADTLAASQAEEVDIYAVVPLSVGKGVVVAGDLAKPSSRTVFAATVRRGESRKALLSRLRSGTLAFWDQDWAGRFLK